ncbi:helix-turn-helix transcriptional regulator [Pseudomonas sp. JUb96]|uniref:S24 family peptidase n=1 Tax=Pseudomonas sp. JUb96 TaxID=2940539 RepID=UPI002225D97E|nr:S24 family peptidase [Pseudomonas sp. JUb96]MCW2272154.1 phage repressor protein C with HTH and peptisase S24 domain [Pseudomonas sp. JUb96]
MNIHDIRKTNLLRLIGVQRKATCAGRWGISPAHLSQILSQKTEKNLGDEVARRIEAAEGLAPGWMDVLQDQVPTQPAIPMPPSPGFITISHLDIRGSMGSGNTPPSHIEVIRDLTVHQDWLRSQGISYSSLANLAIISGEGDSMAGTFNDGDALLVDRGIDEVRTDAVYVFSLEGDLFVKRLQRLTGGGLRMISDNPLYPPLMIEGAALEKLHIQARVLLVWNTRRL